MEDSWDSHQWASSSLAGNKETSRFFYIKMKSFNGLVDDKSKSKKIASISTVGSD